MNATSLMAAPLSVASDMLPARDIPLLQMNWPMIYQGQRVIRSDLPPMVNDPSVALQQLPCIHPSYDGYYEDSSTVSSIALFHPSLGTVLVQQPKCARNFNEPIVTSTQAPIYHAAYHTKASGTSNNLFKDVTSVAPVESDVSNSEIREAQTHPESSERVHQHTCFASSPDGDFNAAVSAAFKTAFRKEVRAGQMLRQSYTALAAHGPIMAGSSLSSNSFGMSLDTGPVSVVGVEAAEQVMRPLSLKEQGEFLSAGVYYGDPSFPKMGVITSLSAADHTGSITTDLLTPSPTSDSLISMLDSSIIQQSGSSVSVSSLNGTSFQTMGSHYPSTNIFPYSTALALTPQVPAYYCPGIIAGQPMQYAVTPLGHSVHLQPPLTQSSAHALSPHGLQVSRPQTYTPRRKPRRIPTEEVQSSQTPFYWTREQAELFDQVHHRIGVDRATDKAIWDELRHYIPNLTQRRVQSRLQKRRLAIRKYYKLNPKSQLKRHHVHPEFQTNKDIYPAEQEND